MFSFAAFGNDLHSGRRSIDFIGRRRLWDLIAAAAVLISILSLGIRGLNAGIEFRGGSEFTVSNVSNTSTRIAEDAVLGAVPTAEEPRGSGGGGDGIPGAPGERGDPHRAPVKGGGATAYHRSRP